MPFALDDDRLEIVDVKRTHFGIVDERIDCAQATCLFEQEIDERIGIDTAQLTSTAIDAFHELIIARILRFGLGRIGHRRNRLKIVHRQILIHDNASCFDPCVTLWSASIVDDDFFGQCSSSNVSHTLHTTRTRY